MVIRRSTGPPPADIDAGDGAPERREGEGVPTVTEFTRRLARMLEGEFADISVQGEISGWSRAASGHTYFTLKDDAAVLGAVLWRSRTLQHTIRDGMKVIASGRISVYPPRGQYQLDCTSIVPMGLGDLQIALEQLKARLMAEGLFDAARKRRLPEFPQRIGIVTSITGAAIRDMLTTLRRRMPMVEVVLRPALVQGAGAAEDVARAIGEINRIADIDLLIVGRGGGSIEDLWAFNEEIVARAIAASRIPVISAVGHEIDFTIADFVADVRAATPTAAAELAVRDRAELLAVLRDLDTAMATYAMNAVRHRRRDLDALMRSRGLARPLDIVRSHQQRLDDLGHRAALALRGVSTRADHRLRLLESTLHALNPANVLARGFAIVERNGVPVTRAAALRGGEVVAIRMHDGRRSARIAPEKAAEHGMEELFTQGPEPDGN
ncbi:MAG TPA: exodeoxyribonuclease VII large subunit [Candidatus Kapabacteria bacterium]|nr:exodeoxyribonuclease VII large subunit [Candidatus Kapabacteria bacterium]